jgi:hypothetical protein
VAAEFNSDWTNGHGQASMRTRIDLHRWAERSEGEPALPLALIAAALSCELGGSHGRPAAVWLNSRRCEACGEPSMRDLLLLTFPLIVVVYFLLFPDQFHALVAWATGR